MKLLARFGMVGSLALGLSGCPDETVPTEGPLAAPPQGEGVQFGTGLMAVEPGDEVQNCYFFKVSDLLKQGGLDPNSTLNLSHVEIFQTEGSHHMNIFRVRTIVPHEESGLDPEKGPYLNKNGVGGCFKSSNWADWPLIANTQEDGTLDWKFPDGVANKLEPDEILMVQSHYVNATTQKSPDDGNVIINFWHLPDSKVVHEMGTIFGTKQSIRICESNPAPEFSGTCTIKSEDPVTVVGANGHFHSRGKNFQMFTYDPADETLPTEEDLFYESADWAEPLMAHGSSIATLPANGGVFYTCDYQWTMPPAPLSCADLNGYDASHFGTPEENLDCCYTFGPVVDRNEHCNIFVYYYPKAENASDVTCF